MQTEITQEWITYEEAQRLTSLGRTTLWKIAKSNQGLKTARVGRAVRINRRSLEQYMERRASEDTIAHESKPPVRPIPRRQRERKVSAYGRSIPYTRPQPIP